MTEFTIKEYPPDKYKADMRTLLHEKGLHDAVKDYCDMIAEEAVGLGYIGYSSVTEWLCDILYLVRLKEDADKT